VYCFTDVTPPTIQCPENIVMGTDPDEDYATVSWTVPVATGTSEIQRNLYIFVFFSVLKLDIFVSLRGNVVLM
jgi:hypothetical protein